MTGIGPFGRNVAASAANLVVGLAGGLAFSVVIARVLGPEGKGLYALAVLLPSLVTALVNLGPGSALVYHAARGSHPRRVVLGNGMLLSLALGGGGLAVGLALVGLGRDRILPGVPPAYLLLALFLIPVSTVSSNLRQIALGIERFRELFWLSVGQAALSVAAAAVLLWGLHGGVAGAIGVRLGVALLLAAVLFRWERKLFGGSSWRVDGSYARAVLAFGATAHVASVLQFLHYRLDVFLLNGFAGPAPVGLYSAAVEIAERVGLASQAASTALYPRVAAEADEAERKRLTPVVSRNVLWLTILGGAAVLALSHWVILLLYSEAFAPAVRLLRILLPGVVALGATRVLANDLAGRGRPGLNGWVSAIGLTVNLGLNLLLIPAHGAAGAAVATTVSYAAMWGLTLVLYCRLSANPVGSVLVPRRSDWELWRAAAASGLRTLRAALRGGRDPVPP